MISPYRNNYIGKYCIEIDNISGSDGVLLEIQNRVLYNNRTLPRSWLRASCKRNKCSRSFMVDYLRNLHWIEGDGFPYKVIMPAPVFRSYKEWLRLGRQVRKGSTSYARSNGWDIDVLNVPLFSFSQTVRRIT